MTSAQQQMRLAEELLAAIRRKKYLDTNPYDLVDTKPISTNFGNKFNRNAPYVSEGALDVPRGSATYTETVRFRGFERKIIARNPLRFDEEGDVVLAESSDEEGDRPEGEYHEEDPFENIDLSELLAPLANPADLPTHPRLSRPYFEQGLTEMIKNAEETLHREQEKLRAMKEHFEWYRGDQAFVPVGDMRTEFDDWLKDTVLDGTPLAPQTNGISSHATALNASLGFTAPEGASTLGNSSTIEDVVQEEEETMHDEDVSMLGAPQIEATATAANTRDTDPTQEPTTDDNTAQTNGSLENSATRTTNGVIDQHHANETVARTSTNTLGIPDDMIIDTTATEQPSNQRMTTRALANSTTSHETPLPVHPFFLHPASVQIPPSSTHEDDPLGMLLAFTAKQNAIVAQWRDLHEGLLQARRLRDEVLRWCKAEGHVGEMSDGEDWIDYDEWGLKPDELKKGKDEDEEVPTVEGSGRRGGRGRRGGAAGGGGGGGDRG